MTKFTTLAVFAFTLAGMAPIEAARAAEPEKNAVLQANEQFYAALNAMFTGEMAPMESVWSHADDVTYLGPDGAFLVGWDSVLADWKKQAAMKLGGAVRPERIQTKAGEDLAVVQNTETGENIVDGKTTKVSLRATNVYRKENGQWKMVSHHTDKLPYLDK